MLLLWCFDWLWGFVDCWVVVGVVLMLGECIMFVISFLWGFDEMEEGVEVLWSGIWWFMDCG